MNIAVTGRPFEDWCELVLPNGMDEVRKAGAGREYISGPARDGPLLSPSKSSLPSIARGSVRAVPLGVVSCFGVDDPSLR